MNISTDASQDCWHDLREPGSYEWWYFDAEDDTQGISVVCIWFAGFAFSPYYMQHYLDWQQGRRQDPPFASDYSGFSFQLYDGKHETVNFIEEGPDGRFSDASSGISASFGQNSFHYDQEADAYLLQVEFDFPARRQRVSATIRFDGIERFGYERQDERNGAGANHQWLLTVPSARVTGSVIIHDTLKKQGRRITLNARGYHDHNLGAMPVHEYIDRWYWGRAYSQRHYLVYYLIYFREESCPPLGLCILHDSETGRYRVFDKLKATESGHAWGLFAPLHSRQLKFSEGDLRVDMQQRDVLDAGPFYLRFRAQVSLQTGSGLTDELRGISEFLKPGRQLSSVMRFFTKSRILRTGVSSFMYSGYNFFKTCWNWFKP